MLEVELLEEILEVVVLILKMSATTLGIIIGTIIFFAFKRKK